MTEYLNFAAGPVQMEEEVLRIGAIQPPYFRTAAFSGIMQRMEEQFLCCLNAPKGARAVFLSSSGTGAMEAAVSCVLNREDHVLAVNGGSFGARFCELCERYSVPCTALRLELGEALTAEKLEAAYREGMTALLVNLCETSTGTLYDLPMLGGFCKSHDLLLVVDAVSAFITAPIDMEASGADVVLTASQKALACAPGVAPVALSPRAIRRVEENAPVGYYLDLQSALKNGERGQTPYTPALSVLLQLAYRMEYLSGGGLAKEQAHIAAMAETFRREIVRYPFTLASQNPANACTALNCVGNAGGHAIFERMMEEKHMYLCPSGGAWKDRLLRVGHMGALTQEHLNRLLEAFDDLNRRNLL